MISLGVAYDGREPEALAFIGQFAEVEQLVCRDAGDGGDIFEPACTFRFHSYLFSVRQPPSSIRARLLVPCRRAGCRSSRKVAAACGVGRLRYRTAGLQCILGTC